MTAVRATSPARPPLADLVRDLSTRIDDLIRWLGLTGRAQGRDFVALNTVRGERTAGSFRIVLAGPKAGLWFEHATGDGGDALDLIAYVRCLPIREAIGDARSFLGIAADQIPGPRLPAPRVDPDDAEKQRRAAQKLWLAGTAIHGTPVQSYLAARGIPLADMGRVPRALRFHSECWCEEVKARLPAMVSAVTRRGQHIATHRTWLELRAGAWRKAKLDAPKKVLGAFRGGHIALWRGESGRSLRDAPDGEAVVITEGIETGLSVAFAVPERRLIAGISLSNLGNVELPPAVTRVVIAADNDLDHDPNGVKRAALQRAVDRHQAEGREAVAVMPDVPGADWNDILCGVDG